MKLLLHFFGITVIFSLCAITANAQMIKAPTKVKTEVKKAPVKFNDDDNPEPVKKIDKSFAYLLLKANKGSAISVFINGDESGKIKAGMSKKLPINNADSFHITLNDGQGYLFDTAFIVSTPDSGRIITVAFPEIDYAAIKAAEEKRIREAKEEELRKIREAEEALRLKRVGLLNVAETDIRDNIKSLLEAKSAIQNEIQKIKNGEKDITPDVIQSADQFVKGKTVLNGKVNVYTDSSNVYGMKEQHDNFLKEIKTDQEKIQKDSFYTFINAALTHKIPMSANVEVAFKASRAADIPFFVPKDSLEDGTIKGKAILLYAMDAKSDSTVYKYLFDNGVSSTNFGTRFPDNNQVFFTPLAYACMNSDIKTIRILLENKAVFFPPSLSKLDKKKQVKFLLKKFGERKDVLALLDEYKYDMDDGTAAINAALGYIDSSMVLVEGGAFSMGCPNEFSAECASDEKPSINVTVDSFYISKFELTQDVWIAMMDDENPSNFKDCPKCPVEMVSWSAVSEFIKRLNKYSGKNYRLPTEAEWEYAARGGKSGNKEFVYAGGNNISELAFYKDNSNKTSVVGSKKPNQLGLYDMSGNVAEWCNDYYAADYFTRSTLINPKGPEVSAQKVVRGGSFMQSSWSSRLSNREGHEESFNNNNTGFRLAMSVTKK